MDDTIKILLNKSKSKESTNVENTLHVDFENKSKLLPSSDLLYTLNLGEQYNTERQNCNKIRLTCVINPICSNVLFNNVTEVVMNEGSLSSVKCLNYGNDGNVKSDDFGNVEFKRSKNDVAFWSKDSAKEAIRDTQLSNSKNDWDYHCGLNIFNNHLLRSNTFKTVCRLKDETQKDDSFNTIDDFMRTLEGEQISGYSEVDTALERPNVRCHVYLNDEIKSFKDSVSEGLSEENGWFGFTNRGKMITYSDEDYKNVLDISKPINSNKACDFIDMYPSRELYSFNPIYNKYQNRIEKNWNYCITYPSSSTTENISFINMSVDSDTNEPLNSLKAIYFDENVKSYSGTDSTVIYSISKHGLEVGDTVNIYKTYTEEVEGEDGNKVEKTVNSRVFTNAEVLSVVDDYIFTVAKAGTVISNEWIKIRSAEEEKELTEDEQGRYVISGDNVDTREFKINTKNTALIEQGTQDLYYIVNNRVNVDVTSQNISYKKTVNGEECSYYVRIFSRLPNFRFCDRKVSEYELYKDGSDLIFKNQVSNNGNGNKDELKYLKDFENTIGKAGFAKNIYSDDITQVIYTDDIDISYLKSNLGLPLTELFFTIVKNNRGYREWYGKGIQDIDIDSEGVEFSHCFGKVNCAFKLSDESIVNNTQYPNIRTINNVDSKEGLNLKKIRVNGKGNTTTKYNDIDKDEIDFYHDINYFGDLCCFSPTEYTEESIQMVQHRFNTAQRELTNRDKSYNTFKTLHYDELVSDDYDALGFSTSAYTFDNVCQRREGYYYEPHYRIPIKSLSSELQSQYPKFSTIKMLKAIDGGDKFEIITLEENYLELNDQFVIYDKTENIPYYGTVEKLYSFKKFLCTVVDEKGNKGNLAADKKRYKILKKDITIPNYAYLTKDGTCRYLWREILQNGFDNRSDIETYPFTNGALYINLPINLYVRRQDPHDVVSMYSLNGDSMHSNKYPYDPNGNEVTEDEKDNYVNDFEIVC